MRTSISLLAAALALAGCSAAPVADRAAAALAADVTTAPTDAGVTALAPGAVEAPAANGATGPRGSVELRPNGIYIDGQPRLLRGGTVQWFRLPPETWDDRLRRFRAAGYNTIDLYVAWRNHEPVEGQFDFTTFDLRRFLDLAQQHGLFVYLRPGPYITNEMDGGGVPAWLFAKTSKRTRDPLVADGTINPRTNDRDWLDAVGRWYGALDEVVRPYLHTNGGPIVLYAVENEYNWFQEFFELDKLADYQGAPERPADQIPDVAGYLGALRDRVRQDGIDVPITTCPGDGTTSAMDGVAGIVPMPNVYGGLPHAEQVAWSLLTNMHDASKNSGSYVDYPTGITETDRSAAVLRRFVVSGMDAVLQFNALGSHQSGRQNAVVLDGGAVGSVQALLGLVERITNVSFGTIGTAFVRPPVGYFHNVVDYYGAVGPSGTLRQHFHHLRRTNLFFDAFEGLIAQAGMPARSSAYASLAGLDTRVAVHDVTVGLADDDAHGKRVHYWLPLAGGAALLSLYNDGGQARTLAPGAIEAFGDRFPRFSSLTVPVEDNPAVTPGAGPGHEYSQLVPIRFALGGDLRLAYSTSEILTLRDGAAGEERLLVVYGPAGSTGELRLDGTGIAIDSATPGFHQQERTAGTLTVTVTHGAPAVLVAHDAAGARLRVLALSTAAAGRTWFLPSSAGEVVLVGVDDIDVRGPAATLAFDSAGGPIDVFALLPTALPLTGLAPVTAYDPVSHLQQLRFTPQEAPTVALTFAQGRVHSDGAEAAADADTTSWQPLGDYATSLERNHIYEGHAWYRAEVTLTAAQAGGALPLQLDGVSDIAGLYVNGHYLLTLSPLGTEVNSASHDRDYGFTIPPGVVHAGKNVITLRTEIWGHGSFLWPRGQLRRVPVPGLGQLGVPGLHLGVPALGFDAEKGVIGDGSLAGVALTGWRLTAGLDGEAAGFADAGFADASWAVTSVPLTLQPGEIRWFRAHFDTSQLPEVARWFAPAVLTLAGHNAKATIYINGRLIGLWLSDTDWLRRGSWLQPERDMWMNTSPDDFPVDRQTLQEGDNVLAIAFEDTSDQTRGEPPGQIDRVALGPVRELLQATASGVRQVAATAERLILVLP